MTFTAHESALDTTRLEHKRLTAPLKRNNYLFSSLINLYQSPIFLLQVSNKTPRIHTGPPPHKLTCRYLFISIEYPLLPLLVYEYTEYPVLSALVRSTFAPSWVHESARCSRERCLVPSLSKASHDMTKK